MIIFLLICIIILQFGLNKSLEAKYNRIHERFDYIVSRLNRMEIDINFAARESMSTRKAIFVNKDKKKLTNKNSMF